MITITLFFYLFACLNRKTQKLKSKVRFFGVDYREIPLDDDNEQMYKIRKWFTYKRDLTLLENSRVSEADKLRLIEQNGILQLPDDSKSKYASNYNTAGLMKDFDFDFDLKP
jgi:hypothetical protein